MSMQAMLWGCPCGSGKKDPESDFCSPRCAAKYGRFNNILDPVEGIVHSINVLDVEQYKLPLQLDA